MQSGKLGWRIPAAVALVIALAVLARICVNALDLFGIVPGSALRSVFKVTFVAAALTAVLLTLKALLWPVEWKAAEAKQILIAGILISAGLLLALIPPFQGPDETAHWKNALQFYRVGVGSEPIAYNLHEIVGDWNIMFHPGVKFDPAKLRTKNVTDVSRAPLPDYIYVHFHSYPQVWLISQFFPKVDTLQVALAYFYSCRGISLLLLIVILYFFNKKYEVPYTLLIFFSLPLVMQQSVVVTPDTFLNLGTIGAVMIFLKLRREPSPTLTAALWLLCLALTYSKPIVGGIVVLPLILLPWRTMPNRKLTVPLLICGVLGAVCVTAIFVINGMRRSNGHFGIEAVNAQLESLHTLAGLRHLVAGFVGIVRQCCDPRRWSGPLGWLDTELSPVHESLILISVLIAVLADAFAYLPRIRNSLRTSRGDVVTCALLIAVILFTNIFCETLIYYVIGVPPQSSKVFAWQMRHMFPCFIAAMLLPSMLAPASVEAKTDSPRIATALDCSALVFLAIVLLFRDIEMAIDVLVRYW